MAESVDGRRRSKRLARKRDVGDKDEEREIRKRDREFNARVMDAPIVAMSEGKMDDVTEGLPPAKRPRKGTGRGRGRGRGRSKKQQQEAEAEEEEEQQKELAREEYEKDLFHEPHEDGDVIAPVSTKGIDEGTETLIPCGCELGSCICPPRQKPAHQQPEQEEVPASAPVEAEVPQETDKMEKEEEEPKDKENEQVEQQQPTEKEPEVPQEKAKDKIEQDEHQKRLDQEEELHPSRLLHRSITTEALQPTNSAIIENGKLYFFYRPRIETGGEGAHDFHDVQRFYMLLSPKETTATHDKRLFHRLFIIGRKKMPDLDKHERFWAFIENANEDIRVIDTILGKEKYETKTAGERDVYACRPAGEGYYGIVTHHGHTHLAYLLEEPQGTVFDAVDHFLSLTTPAVLSRTWSGSRSFQHIKGGELYHQR